MAAQPFNAVKSTKSRFYDMAKLKAGAISSGSQRQVDSEGSQSTIKSTGKSMAWTIDFDEPESAEFPVNNQPIESAPKFKFFHGSGNAKVDATQSAPQFARTNSAPVEGANYNPKSQAPEKANRSAGVQPHTATADHGKTASNTVTRSKSKCSTLARTSSDVVKKTLRHTTPPPARDRAKSQPSSKAYIQSSHQHHAAEESQEVFNEPPLVSDRSMSSREESVGYNTARSSHESHSTGRSSLQGGAMWECYGDGEDIQRQPRIQPSAQVAPKRNAEPRRRSTSTPSQNGVDPRKADARRNANGMEGPQQETREKEMEHKRMLIDARRRELLNIQVAAENKREEKRLEEERALAKVAQPPTNDESGWVAATVSPGNSVVYLDSRIPIKHVRRPSDATPEMMDQGIRRDCSNVAVPHPHGVTPEVGSNVSYPVAPQQHPVQAPGVAVFVSPSSPTARSPVPQAQSPPITAGNSPVLSDQALPEFGGSGYVSPMPIMVHDYASGEVTPVSMPSIATSPVDERSRSPAMQQSRAQEILAAQAAEARQKQALKQKREEQRRKEEADRAKEAEKAWAEAHKKIEEEHRRKEEQKKAALDARRRLEERKRAEKAKIEQVVFRICFPQHPSRLCVPLVQGHKTGYISCTNFGAALASPFNSLLFPLRPTLRGKKSQVQHVDS